MEMSEVKKEIKDYVRDHYKYYGWYPYDVQVGDTLYTCLLYTSPSPRDKRQSRMPSSA